MARYRSWRPGTPRASRNSSRTAVRLGSTWSSKVTSSTPASSAARSGTEAAGSGPVPAAPARGGRRRRLTGPLSTGRAEAAVEGGALLEPAPERLHDGPERRLVHVLAVARAGGPRDVLV